MNTKGCIIGYVPQTLMFVLIATVVSSLGKNICDTRYRNIHPEHSMCKTRNYTCKFRSGIEENVQPLLDLHNHIRNSIQKVVGNNYFEGRNMMNMQWDRELYLIAQRHVLQCTDLPDCSQCHQIDRFHVEQNFAVNTFSSVNHSFNGSVERFKRVIRDWASELRKYNPCVVERFQFLGLPTNWTNIFRATTLKVGCASVTYDSQTKGRFTEIYVCNYGPALLTEGVEIYKPNYQNCNECSNNIKCNTSTPLQSRDLRQQLGDYQQRARKSQRQLIARAPVIEEYMEVDIPEQTRSGLLFLNTIYIEEPSCFIFSYKKNAVPIWSPLTSSVYGIAVRTESNDYVMVQRDTDVYDWMHVFLDIPWIKVFIQVGVGIRTDYGAGEQHIQIKDLVLRRGTCSAL
uniref:Putative CAP peptide n=1 Tax=Superstitionia donensis TaxID=311983 RepID=A0A1V1WBR3_9SCOR